MHSYEDLALYIDGEFIKGGGRREQDIINPATMEVLGKLPHATRDDLDRALKAAERENDPKFWLEIFSNRASPEKPEKR